MLKRKNKKCKIRKDYQAKNLCNPFFRKPKKEVNKKVAWLLSFLSFIFIASALWFFFSSQVWVIRDIKIEGLTRFSSENIQEVAQEQFSKSAALVFKQSNIFLLNKDVLRQTILDTYNFSNLIIDKKLPNTIILKISERPYSFIFQQGSDYYYADRQAYIIPETSVSEEDKGKYLILENKNTTDLIQEKDRINISENYLEFVFALNDYLDISQEVKAEKYIIDMEFNTIKVKLKDGPEAYFNTKKDVKEQLESLILVKKEKIKDNFSNTNYIDLRYGDRIFIN